CVGLGIGFVGIGAEVIGVGPRIMGGHALIALGIIFDRLFRRDKADQLRLDALEPSLERRVRLTVPGGIFLVQLAQRLDALTGKRMRAVVTVLGIDRQAIFLVLQLL